MKTLNWSLAVALLACAANPAQAATSIGLSTNYSLDYVVANGTREAGAIAYNWDTDTLMVVGDENNWNEYDLNGVRTQRVLAASYRDPEGLAYVGGGQFVVGQEQEGELFQLIDLGVNGAYRLYSGRTDSPSFIVPGAGDAAVGMEGLAYDRSTGDFYVTKEDDPQGLWRVSGVDFAAGTGTVEQLFDIEALLGLNTISDIAVLSNPNAFAGEEFADNLLILSATSKLLIEVTKAGDLVSSFDLNGIGVNKIEGLTLDNAGNIYLIGEEGPVTGGIVQSGLIKLSRNVPAVPEPATWAMMIAGLGAIGSAMRRRRRAVSFA